MRKSLASRFGAAVNMNGKVKCPRCGMKYDLLSKVAGEALGGLCAACWYEKKSHEGGRSK
jgi:NMD protein affecting ribosome stability and mRNA decay